MKNNHVKIMPETGTVCLPEACSLCLIWLYRSGGQHDERPLSEGLKKMARTRRGPRRGLFCYTTEVPVEKTIMQIETLLARAGANAVLKEFDGTHNITAISFRIDTPDGQIPIRLPMNPKKIQAILNNQVDDRKIAYKYRNNIDQARRVGWRIVYYWLEAQMAIIEHQMAEVEEVFLPYVTDVRGNTLYQKYVKHRTDYLLPDGK